MAATDLPMGGLGVTDPRQWSTTDWLSDALPQLALDTDPAAITWRTGPTIRGPRSLPVRFTP